jgi:hypothetical protein
MEKQSPRYSKADQTSESSASIPDNMSDSGTSNLQHSKEIGLSMAHMYVDAPPPSKKGGVVPGELHQLWETFEGIAAVGSPVKGFKSDKESPKMFVPMVGGVDVPAESPFAKVQFRENDASNDQRDSTATDGSNERKSNYRPGEDSGAYDEEENEDDDDGIEDWMRELMNDPAMAAVVPWLKATPETAQVPRRLPPIRNRDALDPRESVMTRITEDPSAAPSMRPSVAGQETIYSEDADDGSVKGTNETEPQQFDDLMEDDDENTGQYNEELNRRDDCQTALKIVLETDPISMMQSSPRLSTNNSDEQQQKLGVDKQRELTVTPVQNIEFGESDPEGFGWNLMTKKGFASALFIEHGCLTASAAALEMLLAQNETIFAWNTFYPH